MFYTSRLGLASAWYSLLSWFAARRTHIGFVKTQFLEGLGVAIRDNLALAPLILAQELNYILHVGEVDSVDSHLRLLSFRAAFFARICASAARRRKSS